jgi:hypothetical protein
MNTLASPRFKTNLTKPGLRIKNEELRIKN